MRYPVSRNKSFAKCLIHEITQRGAARSKSATVASAPTGYATASRLATVASNTSVLNVDIKGHHESTPGEAYNRSKGVTIASAREELAIRASSARVLCRPQVAIP